MLEIEQINVGACLPITFNTQGDFPIELVTAHSAHMISQTQSSVVEIGDDATVPPKPR